MSEFKKKEDEKNILSTLKVLANAGLQDAEEMVESATSDMLKIANLYVLTGKAVKSIERGVFDMKRYIKWSPVKFLGMVVAAGMLGGVGYYYLHFNFLSGIDNWGIYGHILLFALLGGFLSNLFDFSVLNTVFDFNVNKEPEYTLRLDFYTNFRFSKTSEAGVWLTSLDIQNAIYNKEKRAYDVLEIELFLTNEPFVLFNETEKGKEYLIEKMEEEPENEPTENTI